MKTLGYYNGRYDEIDEMTVPMNDRSWRFWRSKKMHSFEQALVDACF